MEINDALGLGIDINIENIKKHPYQRLELRHYDGRLKDIKSSENKILFLIDK